MKTPASAFLLLLVCLQLSMDAQVQWYQSQDGHVQPNGTYASQIQSLTPHSFVAAYLWQINNENYTWKISKSTTGGAEQRAFFLSGSYAMMEMKAGYRNSIYLLIRSFPFAQDPQYTLYKLDSNLQVKAQRTLSFPNAYSLFNLNAFETDKDGNVYLAGDGQYPDGPGYSPASFILKTDRNLVTRWSRMDSVSTSFARIHIERNGTVRIIEDSYTFFPDIRVQKISAAGQLLQARTYQADPARLSFSSTLDRDDNLLLYGTTEGPDGQSMYLYKVSRQTGNTIYRKNYFPATGTNLDDLKLDEEGNIYALLSQYLTTGSQCRLSRIRSRNGSLYWSQAFPFSQDSCILKTIVTAGEDRLYVIGERKSGPYFSKGFALQLKKNGQREENFIAPDSVSFQRSHFLLQGIADRENRLIAIGNTNDLDSITGGSSYFSSFALRLAPARHGHGCGTDDRPGMESGTMAKTAAAETVIAAATVYPNPAQDRITVTNPDPAHYNLALIYDMSGNLQAQQAVNGTTASFGLERLASGVYLLVLRSSKGLPDKSTVFAVKR
ncbi:MAG: T9SS type A sorting domain-containing protein [Sphingobacteriales bacterium]|nr:T9SS type A sorting domain-containing protein [Sphingobacteriales bacterium]